MRTTVHVIEAQITRKLWLSTAPGADYDTAHPVIRIAYEYRPRAPAYTPRGEYGPIDPPEPAEIDILSAKLVDGDGLDPSLSELMEWADDWLNEDGFDLAVENAEHDRWENKRNGQRI